MPNNICIAEHAGFCLGVKRAADAVEKMIPNIAKGEKIYTLSHLIHNETYNRWLEENGVHAIEVEDISFVCDNACENSRVTVFVRAHGISVETEVLLQECKKRNPYFDYVDLTCPYVKKIHKIADGVFGDDDMFAVLGSAKHPEVIGIMSHARAEKIVFESADEIEEFLKNDTLSKMHKKTF